MVLDLDRRIRDFSMPMPLRKGQSRALFLQKGSLSAALEAGECTCTIPSSGIEMLDSLAATSQNILHSRAEWP